MFKRNLKKVLCVALAATMVLSLAACTTKKDKTSTEVTKAPSVTQAPVSGEVTPEAPKNYTYHYTLTLSPSNWNELTYQDNNDTEIMGYIGSSFFGFDFKFDENGEIIPGDFRVVYEAATGLEDISDKVDAKWNVPKNGKGYAYKITLRDDLKWDDGTKITAEDFVYSMKEQLNPLFQNYRADSYYNGSTIIVNARNYVMQGQNTGVDNASTHKYTLADLKKGADGVYTQPDGNGIWFAMKEQISYSGGMTVEKYKAYLDADSYAKLSAMANDAGRVQITDETIALFTKLIDTDDWGHETPDLLPEYWIYQYQYPEVDFSEVGIFVGDKPNELILVLEKSLSLLKEDGSLSYTAAYNMSSLPLVKKDLYEKCKIAPSEGSTLWTSNYNSSLATTASWGPYKLESYQAGKQHSLVKNDNWYGYSLPENEGLYQTNRIVCDIVENWNASWLKFLAGENDGIGIDISIADEYKGSDRAYFTPDDYVGALQLQSNVEQLKARETDGINKSILSYVDFRKGLSLSIDRADYAAKVTTSSLAGFGIFTSVHYYDVENGGAYRNTDEARQVLCDVYAVDASKYSSLEEAEDHITGYNLTAARTLITKAYNEALANGDIKATDKVLLTFGTGAITESTQRMVDYLKETWTTLVKTTPLEGRLDVELKDFGTKWSNDFRAGAYDICLGGWTGAAWDPGYFLLAYLSPDYMYSQAWDTSSQMMTFTMKGVGANGEDITETMSLMDWYNCLNGLTGAKYDWSQTALPNSKRLQLIAALEKEVLSVYYTVPLYYTFSASLISYKVDNITYEYNTFMGYGGLKYRVYNYDDEAWAAEVAKQNGQLNYK